MWAACSHPAALHTNIYVLLLWSKPAEPAVRRKYFLCRYEQRSLYCEIYPWMEFFWAISKLTLLESLVNKNTKFFVLPRLHFFGRMDVWCYDVFTRMTLKWIQWRFIIICIYRSNKKMCNHQNYIETKNKRKLIIYPITILNMTICVCS